MDYCVDVRNERRNGGTAILRDKVVNLIRLQFKGRAEGAGAWMIYAGVAVDLFSDGIMIGTGATIASSLALLLALKQVSAEVPEGFVTIATFKKQDIGRSKRILIAASFALPILIGTTIGFWALKDAPESTNLHYCPSRYEFSRGPTTHADPCRCAKQTFLWQREKITIRLIDKKAH